MKSIFTTASAALLATIVAAPAMAGGFAEPAMEPVLAPAPASAPVAPVVGWGGFYLGGQIGTLGADLQFEGEETRDLEGNFYGLHVGYLYDIGNFVLGGEFDYDIQNLEEIDGETLEDSEGKIMRLKLRAGYNLGRVLPYATAGVARFEVTEGGETVDTDGTFFGAGIAFKATENILIGGEVLQHQFDDAFDVDGYEIDATTFSLRASYRF